MTTMTQNQTPVKTSRGLRWAAKQATYGVLVITEGKASDRYLVLPIPANVETYEFTKLDGKGTASRYTCRVLGDGETCECLGFVNHGHCRHLEAIVALQNVGQLSFDVAAAPKPEAKNRTPSNRSDEPVEVPVAETLGTGWCQGQKRRFPVAIINSGTHKTRGPWYRVLFLDTKRGIAKHDKGGFFKSQSDVTGIKWHDSPAPVTHKGKAVQPPKKADNWEDAPF